MQQRGAVIRGPESQPVCSFVSPWRSDGGWTVSVRYSEDQLNRILTQILTGRNGQKQCLVSGLGSFVGDAIRIWVFNRSWAWGVILTWVTEQRSVIKGQGSGHLMTRRIHTQRGFRRGGVKWERKAWGGICQNSGQGSPEKAMFRKTHATQRPECSPPPDLSVNRLSRTVMNSWWVVRNKNWDIYTVREMKARWARNFFLMSVFEVELLSMYVF